jgi:hypothetical protein
MQAVAAHRSQHCHHSQGWPFAAGLHRQPKSKVHGQQALHIALAAIHLSATINALQPEQSARIQA